MQLDMWIVLSHSHGKAADSVFPSSIYNICTPPVVGRSLRKSRCVKMFPVIQMLLREGVSQPVVAQQAWTGQMWKQKSHASTSAWARMSVWINQKQFHKIFKWARIATQSTPFCSYRWCHLEYVKICGQSELVKMLLRWWFSQRAKTAERCVFPSPYLAIHPTKLHGCLTYG